MVKRILFSAVIAMLPAASDAATEAACWDQWYEQQLLLQPKRDDTIDLRTGKMLSKTYPAKASREKKHQALKDSLALRGKTDSKWLEFKAGCVN